MTRSTLIGRTLIAAAVLAANTDKGEAATAKPKVTVLPKITVKDCGGNPKAVLAQPEGSKEREPLIRVYGIARGTKQKKLTNPNGDVNTYDMIVGDFRAVNMKSGERFQSGVLYLPEGIHEMISSPLDAAKSANEQAEVTFGLDLFSERRTNVAGYGYGATILGEPQESDAVARLEASFDAAGAPALPAPPADAPKA